MSFYNFLIHSIKPRQNELEDMLKKGPTAQTENAEILKEKKLKSYPEHRSECSRWSCADIDRDKKLYRDMCIHECISAFCYYEVYKDLDKKMPKFENDAKESEVRETRKS